MGIGKTSERLAIAGWMHSCRIFDYRIERDNGEFNFAWPLSFPQILLTEMVAEVDYFGVDAHVCNQALNGFAGILPGCG